MKLIRQLIIKKLEIFNYEKEKGYLDIWGFYQNYALCNVILNEKFGYEINYRRIEKINKLWNYLNSISIKEGIDNTSRVYNLFSELINQDMRIINLFLSKTYVKEIKEEEKVKKYDRGVIGEVVKLK